MGAGSPGFCKICAWEFITPLNRKIEESGGDPKKFSAAAAQRFANEIDPGFSFDRETFRKHKLHITHPLVTLQKQALANPVILPKTNQGKLEAIADIGIQRAIDNPDTVTVDHALKALGILEQKKDRKESIWVVLAKAMTGQQPEVEAYIEGEYRELTTGEEDQS